GGTVSLGGQFITGQLSLRTTSDDGAAAVFHPSGHAGDGYVIEPLKLMHMQYGTFVAIRVTNCDSNYRIRLNWVRKERAKSLIYLVDNVGNYYYPIASSLSGEVVSAAPKIGIVVFEPFTRPCESASMHLSGAKLEGGSRAKPSLVFDIAAIDL